MRGECRWKVAVCGAGLYLASLVLPTAAPFSVSDTTYPGYVAFGVWEVVLDWNPQDIDCWLLPVAWLANPAIWLAVGFAAAGWWRAEGVAACCGLFLALAVLPRYHPIVASLPGYWAWAGSAVLLLAAGAYAGVRERGRSRSCT